ncbi:jhamt [Trichonephila clavata]|uniref:Jhamt n=1 Tax=Trichonephila clavata TaxID=2740835 RepID=A0A8X6JKR5_TRICU|nr:jhamt [Trichonephila clavata]
MAERSYLEEAVRYDYSRKFVKRCADVFHWEDLSEHVVMDIGCGAELNCCHAILVQFPRVRALIAVDKESTVFQKALLEGRRIHFCVGDIQERDSLKSYEGKSVSDHQVFERNGCRARFHLFGNEAKGFCRPFLGEDTHRKYYYFGFFHTSGIGAEGKRKSRALCVCVKRRVSRATVSY